MKISRVKQLKFQIEHLQHFAGEDCNCPVCDKQEQDTYLDGLRDAVKILEL